MKPYQHNFEAHPHVNQARFPPWTSQFCFRFGATTRFLLLVLGEHTCLYMFLSLELTLQKVWAKSHIIPIVRRYAFVHVHQTHSQFAVLDFCSQQKYTKSKMSFPTKRHQESSLPTFEVDGFFFPHGTLQSLQPSLNCANQVAIPEATWSRKSQCSR